MDSSGALQEIIAVPLQVKKWRAFQQWDRAHLRTAFAGGSVTVGNYSMDFEDFLVYCDRTQDDMPLYLFDKDFAKKAPHLADDYQVCSSSYSCNCGLLIAQADSEHEIEIVAAPRTPADLCCH